jgi:hypothetical protein
MVAPFAGHLSSLTVSESENMEGLYVARDRQSIRSVGPTKTMSIRQYGAARLFRMSARLRKTVINAGDIADYVSWLMESFGDAPFLSTREQLWELMARRVTQNQIRGMEFGVAYGYGTGWWLSRLPAPGLRWDGFDRFTGLPRAWRVFGAGAFDADGQPPAIDDARVTWHIGNVEDELKNLTLDRDQPQQVLVLFDLDIFEPSLAAWEHLRESLRPGDLLYFDEAFDADERKLLNEHILPVGKYECVGATPMTLGLQVVQLDPR